MIRTIQAHQAEDGSIHLVERDAIIASIRFQLASECRLRGHPNSSPALISEEAVGLIEARLPTLLPLFNRLTDPSNRAPVAAKPEQSPTPSMTMAQSMDLASVEPEATAPALPDIDPSDLRLGQLVQIEVFLDADQTGGTSTHIFDAIIGQIDSDFNICTTDSSALPEGFVEPFDFSFITKVLKQPEELLGMEAAVLELDALEAAGPGDLSTPEGKLNHTRRILLHRRIEQLEEANG